MAGIFISCFPIFPPNMSGISVYDKVFRPCGHTTVYRSPLGGSFEGFLGILCKYPSQHIGTLLVSDENDRLDPAHSYPSIYRQQRLRPKYTSFDFLTNILEVFVMVMFRSTQG